MTTPQANTHLAHLRNAIADLANLALNSQSFETYVQRAANALAKHWPGLSDPALVHQPPPDKVARASTALAPARQGQPGHFIHFPLTTDYEFLTIEFVLDDPDANGELLDTLQLWSQQVNQVWEAAPSQDIKEELHLYRGLSLVAQRVNRELASERVLQEACQSIVESIEAVNHVGVVINDNAPINGTVVAEFPDFGNRGVPIKLEGYAVYERMLKTLKPVVINSVAQADELLGENQQTLLDVGIKSVLLLPLVVQNSLIGSIGLDVFEQEHVFTSAEIEVMDIVATQIAIGVHNAELFEEVSSRIVSEALSSRVTEKLPLRAELDELFQAAARELGITLGARTAIVHFNEAYLNPDSLARSTQSTDEG